MKTGEAIRVKLLGSRGEVARSHLDGDKTPSEDGSFNMPGWTEQGRNLTYVFGSSVLKMPRHIIKVNC